jgi:hypothetical protein
MILDLKMQICKNPRKAYDTRVFGDWHLAGNDSVDLNDDYRDMK